MFAHQTYSTVLRAAALVPVTTNSQVLGEFIDPNTGAITLVVEIAGRTAGNVDVVVTGSGDGTTGSFFQLGAGTALLAQAANGLFYISLNRNIPRFLQVILDPHGGFDGTVALSVRSERQVVAA